MTKAEKRAMYQRTTDLIAMSEMLQLAPWIMARLIMASGS